MNGSTAIFETPSSAGRLSGSHIAVVVSVQDPMGIGRVQVRLQSADGVDGQDAPIWARVAVPFAGPNRGAFMLPDVDDEVLVTFLQGDSRYPIVVGGMWNGNQSPPETIGGDRIDRWTIVGKAGTRIAIVESGAGQEKITFETPGGVKGELTDAGGGKVEFQGGGATVTMQPSGITVQSGAKVTIQASQVEVSAGMVTVNSGYTRVNGLLHCDILLTNTVISSVYTPGAGNIW